MTDQYSIAHYSLMTRDRARLGPYVEAVRRAVEPDSVVMDIGTGTGVVAFAAAMAGARRVIAVEPNEVIELARQIARDNDLGEKIEFHRTRSTELQPPERADVIVSDLRGVSPFHPGHVQTIIDARERLLAPGGCLIARADTVFAAPAEVPESYGLHVGHWDDNLLGMNMAAARELAANVRFHHETRPDQLLSEPRTLSRLDYATITSPNLDVRVAFEAMRAGTVHGFSVWFESELDDDLRVSTAPGTPLLAYGRPLYPVEKPLAVQPGDRVQLRFRTALVRGSYVTSWSGAVNGGEQRFSQSTLGVTDFTPSDLALLGPDSRPRSTGAAEALRALLGWMDGTTSVDELAHRAYREFGDTLGSWNETRAWVSRTIREYAEQ
jgi:protein arginine N-methyltransferase 1